MGRGVAFLGLVVLVGCQTATGTSRAGVAPRAEPTFRRPVELYPVVLRATGSTAPQTASDDRRGPTGTVEGRVLDADGAPVQGASVSDGDTSGTVAVTARAVNRCERRPVR